MKELFFWHKAHGSHQLKQASDDSYLVDLNSRGHEGVLNPKLCPDVKDPWVIIQSMHSRKRSVLCTFFGGCKNKYIVALCSPSESTSSLGWNGEFATSVSLGSSRTCRLHRS